MCGLCVRWRPAIVLLIVLIAVGLTACGKARALSNPSLPTVPTVVDSVSRYQTVTLDLSKSAVDSSLKYSGDRLYVDPGNASTNGLATVKINSSSADTMTLVPGQEIVHANIQELFFNWTPQPNKTLKLLVSDNMSFYAPAVGTSNTNVPRKDFSGATSYTLVGYAVPASASSITIIPAASNKNGFIINRLEIRANTDSFLNSSIAYAGGVALVGTAGGDPSANTSDRVEIENIYVPPGTGGVYVDFQHFFGGTMYFQIIMNYKML